MAVSALPCPPSGSIAWPYSTMEQYCVAELQVVIPHANAWPPSTPPPLLEPELLAELPEPEPPPDDEVAASPVPPSPFPVSELEQPVEKPTAAASVLIAQRAPCAVLHEAIPSSPPIQRTAKRGPRQATEIGHGRAVEILARDGTGRRSTVCE